MDKTPRVSVIIPVYNGEAFIKDAVDSVLNQTFRDFELIVVNDGSEDNTEDVLLPYIRSIRYIKTKNRGVSAARNMGIRLSKGEFVAFLDQDDVFHPRKLEVTVSYLDAHPDMAMVYTPIDRIDSEGTMLQRKRLKGHSGDIFPRLFLKSFIAPSMAVCRKKIFSKIGMFSETLSSEGEDYDLFLRIASRFKVGYVNEPLVIYRLHPGNVSKTKQEVAPFRYEQVLGIHAPHLLSHYRLGWWVYRKRMSKVYREKARVYLKQDRHEDAISALKASLALYPFRMDVLLMMFRLTIPGG
ncbi:MAG: glycosyltransferase family 2 protein [Deltaproteobacteria bacterium]|nr:MAG: glycosyltransferase family 2 protein [Deltaproteobacteria bacterium]